MDPLPVTASIIALLGAVGQVGKGLQKLKQIREIPDSANALINEVTALHIVVQELKTLSSDKGDLTPLALRLECSLEHTIAKLRMNLGELDTLISHRLMVANDRNAEPKVRKFT